MQGKEIITASKGVVAMLSAIVSFVSESITPLFIILVMLMVIDYLSGLSAGALEGALSSKAGFKGIIKKASYIVLVVVCILADYSIVYLGANVGINISLNGIFTLIITCWLIGVELLSIIENLGRLGAPVPEFLKNAFKQFKDAAEKAGEEAIVKKEGESNV